MADLDPLIRFRRHIVDEKRRFLARLYEESEQLQKTKEEEKDSLAKETQIAHALGTAEALSDLGKYSEATKKRIKTLDNAIRKMEMRIAAAQEDMRAAFAELKKIEIIHRRREEAEEAEEKHKEDQELDEIALGTYLKNQVED